LNGCDAGDHRYTCDVLCLDPDAQGCGVWMRLACGCGEHLLIPWRHAAALIHLYPDFDPKGVLTPR
jgi:hypothetical protein